MKILVQKFGGTSVDRAEHRALAARKVIQAQEAGYDPVVVVSAIGRAGAPYATDTLVKVLKDIDPQVPPAPREMDMMMACGEIISTVVFAHTLQTLGYQSDRALRRTGGHHHRPGVRQRAHPGDSPALYSSAAGAGLYPGRLRIPGYHRAERRVRAWRDHHARPRRQRYDRLGAGRGAERGRR